jgi:hypothetical protein
MITWRKSSFTSSRFCFSLYLLSCYGGDWRPSTFSEDTFLRAFPRLLGQVQPRGSHYSPEKVARLSYSLCCLEKFPLFVGLVEIDRSGNDRYSEEFSVKKMPLLDEFVQFHL